jgi:hypothetical protein
MAKKEKKREITNLQSGGSMLGRTGGINTGHNVSPDAEAHYGDADGSLTNTTDEGTVARKRGRGDETDEE